MLFVGIFSASCSFWLLMYAPRSLHAFDTQASSVELVGRIQSLLTARARGIAAWLNFELPEAPPEPSALALALPLSLCAGLLSEWRGCCTCGMCTVLPVPEACSAMHA
jgi:hypothetical protein